MNDHAASGQGTPPGVPAPGSCDRSADTLFAQIRPIVARFAFEQRVWGDLKAHDSFTGILTEHALALEEVRDMLRSWLPKDHRRALNRADAAIDLLEEQITYVRALGSVAVTEEEEDAK